MSEIYYATRRIKHQKENNVYVEYVRGQVVEVDDLKPSTLEYFIKNGFVSVEKPQGEEVISKEITETGMSLEDYVKSGEETDDETSDDTDENSDEETEEDSEEDSEDDKRTNTRRRSTRSRRK